MGQSRYLPVRTLRALAEQTTCADCGDPGPFEREHTVPHALGGSNEPENVKHRCVRCHKIKTRRDMRMIAKANRLRRKRNGTWIGKKSRPMQSRGFQARPSGHSWPKRKMQSRERRWD